MNDEIEQSSFDRANFIRNLRDHDLGLWNANTRPLGRGATFAVRRFVSSEDSSGIDDHVAIKSVLTTYATGETRTDKTRLASAMLELRVLSHPEVRAAENIMRLLQVGWESDAVDFDRKWPALVVEYADRGTLTDLFDTHDSVCSALKWHLCLDVSRGLRVLHRLKVVHGDIKLSNILLYTNPRHETDEPDRPVVAKVGDVGGALLDMDVRCRLPSGSPPWDAPESREWMTRDDLLKTDIYSFGLLVWRIFLDGKNPFTDRSAGAYAESLSDEKIKTEKLRPDFGDHVQNTLRQSLAHRDGSHLESLCQIFQYSLTLDRIQRNLEDIIQILEANTNLTKEPL